MVVGADVEILRPVAGAISALGLAVETVTSVEQAMTSLHGVTAIVLDLLAPGIDGEAFKDVHVPTIVLSAYGARPVLISDRIMKPFTLERFNEAVLGLGAQPQPIMDVPSQGIAIAA